MRKVFLLLIYLFVASLLISPVFAETKMDRPDGGKILKLPKTENDPILMNGGVYPMWGPPCQRYTYHTTYQDKDGRPPEYVRMFFNGGWIDVPKEDPNNNDYKAGVRYIYKFVPNKIGPNFFFFEASNGLGKTREGIIDSPGNGPVLFESDFKDNEIAVIKSESREKVLSFPVGEEWVGGVALSDNGRYLAAKTSSKVYFFDTSKPERPLWVYDTTIAGMIGGDVKGGVDISGDGSKIVASVGSLVLLFDKGSNRPLWQYEAGNAYNVAISKDGRYLAAATAGVESDVNTNLLILWKADSQKPLWQYHASGNFHDVSLSDNGQWIAAATGCPDRRAYIFSKDSNVPVVRSEMLTYDSPVPRSKIAGDGSLAVFNTDGGPNSDLVLMFSKDSITPLWKFNDGILRSSRALGMTPDGKRVVAANMMGNVYLLDGVNGAQIKRWQLNISIGGLDISDDGSLIAIAGTDNKVHLLQTDSSDRKEVSFDEFVEEVDVSADGKYVAAGTGGAVYFFEEIVSPNKNKVFACATVVEPKPMSEAMASGGSENKAQGSYCGDGKCEGPETVDDCRADCDQNRKIVSKRTFGKLLGMIFGFGLIGSVGLLVVYLVVRKSYFRRHPVRQLADSGSAVWFNKKVVIVLVLSSSVFLILSTVAIIVNKSHGGVIQEDSKPIINSSGECGNSVCEPIVGETKESCPKDCSGEG